MTGVRILRYAQNDSSFSPNFQVSSRRQVRKSGRFRQAVAPARIQRPFDCAVQVYFITNRDKQRLDLSLRPHDRADNLALIREVRETAACLPRRFEFANQAGLGAADGGNIKEKPQVARDAQSPRVGDTLSVHEHEVRRDGKLFEGFYNQGHLAEGEKAGNVGEVKLPACGLDFGEGQTRPVEDNDGGHRLPGKASGGNIDPGDEPGTYDRSFSDNGTGEPCL